MKKLILFIALSIVFTSCEKAVLQRTTVKVISDDITLKVDFPNDAKKHLNQYSPAELKQMYIQSFADQLGKRKIDIVDENPDYVIEIKSLKMSEYVSGEFEDGKWYNLSRIDIQGEYIVTESLVDVPDNVFVDHVVEEEISTKSKNKKSKYSKNSAQISGFGGAEGALQKHAAEARKDMKKIFKSNQ